MVFYATELKITAQKISPTMIMSPFSLLSLVQLFVLIRTRGQGASISNTVSHVRIYGGNCISYIHFIVLVRHKRNLVLPGSTAKRPFECSVAA